MNLNQMKIVSTLLDSDLNISLAADKLFRVQSALSNQLRLLEEELGDRLFERRGKRLVKPTPLCEVLMPEIEHALLAEKNIKALALEHTNTGKGHLRIATTHTQARYFLPRVIREFRSEYPEVQLSINQGSPAEFLNMLRRQKIDFAVFSSENEVPSNFAKTKCYEWNRILIVHRGHPLEHTRLTLRNIAKYPIITYMPDFAERGIIEKTFNRANIALNVAFSAGDTDVIKTYARLDLGVAIVAQMAQPGSKNTNGNLVSLDLSHLFRNSTTQVVHLKNLTMRQYMNDFSDLLYQHGKSFEKSLR